MITNGIIELAKTVNTYYDRLTLKTIEEALLNILNRETNRYGERFIWYMGSTYYYGENCENLKELRKAREMAIIARNNTLELTGIRQRICRRYGKNKQICKYLRQRRKADKKSRRYRGIKKLHNRRIRKARR